MTMTRSEKDSTTIEAVMEALGQQGFEGFAEAIRILLDEAMKLERNAVLRAEPYERTPARRGHANGFKPKTLQTRLGAIPVRVPQVRGDVDFYPSALERGVRSERALKLAIAEMYVQGVSTRRVTAVLEQLCGLEISAEQVSRAAALLDEQLERWRNRPLDQPIRYLILDARYEKVRQAGSVVSCAVLVATAVRADGKRTVLGVSVSLSEAEVHWRDFLASLQDRGLHGTTLIVSDDHPGLRAALRARMPGVPWQRCQCHLQRNAAHHAPKIAMRKPLADGLRDVFSAPERAEADRRLAALVKRHQADAPDLATWLEDNVPESLTVFAVPEPHRRRLRTTNMIENLNKQIKRRTAVAGLFPNPASALRLVSAVLMEISEDWETGRVYLGMDAE